ncbi:MAG TPA: lysyl oxidase family protein [Mycobacteriales bacterium]|nr:lysyl oxidase family protein [Mycobacteriales bacterium]
MRARLITPLVAALALLLLLLVAPTRAASPVVATLKPGQSAFWGYHQSPTYRITVRPGGWRLRVAYDHPDFRRAAYGVLRDPSGKEVASLSGWDSGEAYVLHPAPGTWSLEMSSQYDEVRMRAKLELAPAAAPRRAAPLLPNLRLVPPHEFTFTGQLSGGRFLNAPGVGGVPSCSADDTAEQQGVRCLRFSLGPANVGAGPLQLEFPPYEGLVMPGNATQLVTWSDGRVTRRAAGQFEYHKTHAHYHHSGFGTLELLRVDDPARGAMTHVGAGPKQGFCTGDVKIAEWSVFGGHQNSADSTCVESAGLVYDPTQGTKMGLSPGWADLYSWEQDGNYVEFGLNGDGRYVVRSTADALNNVLESVEGDNTAYAYIQVTGSDITVLERGRGQSPWDRRKVIVRDGLHDGAGV